LAAKQMEEPWLRFGGEDGPATVDPTVKTENISSDTMEATALGLKNLNRVIDMLPSATTQLGEDFSLMQETYKTILTHRRNWFNAVSLLVGGVMENRTLGGRGSESFTRVPRDKQREAVKFLSENAFTTPRNLLQPAIINRFKYYGVADDVMSQQKTLMESLLSARRFKLLMDGEVLDAETAYTALQFLSDVQNGIWAELKEKQPAVDVLRRGLQRGYLEHLKQELSPKEGAPAIISVGEETILAANSRATDFRGVARHALKELAGQITEAQTRVQEPTTRVHLADCQREIELILSTKK